MIDCVPEGTKRGRICKTIKSQEEFRTLTYKGNTGHACDGAEMTLFIWREFCESRNPPEIHGAPNQEIVERVRKGIGKSTRGIGMNEFPQNFPSDHKGVSSIFVATSIKPAGRVK